MSDQQQQEETPEEGFSLDVDYVHDGDTVTVKAKLDGVKLEMSLDFGREGATDAGDFLFGNAHAIFARVVQIINGDVQEDDRG